MVLSNLSNIKLFTHYSYCESFQPNASVGSLEFIDHLLAKELSLASKIKSSAINYSSIGYIPGFEKFRFTCWRVQIHVIFPVTNSSLCGATVIDFIPVQVFISSSQIFLLRLTIGRIACFPVQMSGGIWQGPLGRRMEMVSWYDHRSFCSNWNYLKQNWYRGFRTNIEINYSD